MIMLLVAAAGFVGADALTSRVEAAPRDVREFVMRRAGCNHFLGEDPYGDERRRQLAEALRDLRCDRLEADGRAIQKRYRHKADVVELLDATKDMLGWW